MKGTEPRCAELRLASDLDELNRGSRRSSSEKAAVAACAPGNVRYAGVAMVLFTFG